VQNFCISQDLHKVCALNSMLFECWETIFHSYFAFLKNIISSCLSLPSAVITDVHHYTWLYNLFFKWSVCPIKFPRVWMLLIAFLNYHFMILLFHCIFCKIVSCIIEVWSDSSANYFKLLHKWYCVLVYARRYIIWLSLFSIILSVISIQCQMQEAL
jgi:hypothetical protein